MDSIQFQERFEKMSHNLYDNYDTIASYCADSNQKVFLGDKDNKVCRFCGRKEGVVEFSEEAHALSNLIGNNRIFSYYECDECNTAMFSVFESNFAEFMKLKHTLSQTHGKRGVPSYKPNSQSFSRIDVKGAFTTKVKEDEDPIAEVDIEHNLIHYHGKRTYVPQKVYKCLLKMALTIIPEAELPNVGNAMDFLMGRANYKCKLPVIYLQYSGRQPFGRPICFLYKRKEERAIEFVPQYLFLLAYSNFVFEMYIPFCDADKFIQGNNMQFIFAPTPEDLYQFVKPDYLYLESEEKIVNEDVYMDMHFESYKEEDLTKEGGNEE